jgi:exodeoxyribonuclease III
MMRILSFNVNGIRAIRETPRLLTCINEQAPDILCLQEIKTQDPKDLDFLKSHYPNIALSVAEKRGYSGVALCSKTAPISLHTNFLDPPSTNTEVPPFVSEGRLITAEFAEFFLVTTYVPNTKPKLARLEERRVWESWMRRHIQHLQIRKPVILCGDLNVCHTNLDYWSPKAQPKTPGLSPEEKEDMDSLLSTCDLVDSFRFLHPSERQYTFWSPWANSKRDNKGWRLDYILVSRSLSSAIKEAACLDTYCTSDHGPVLVALEHMKN